MYAAVEMMGTLRGRRISEPAAFAQAFGRRATVPAPTPMLQPQTGQEPAAAPDNKDRQRARPPTIRSGHFVVSLVQQQPSDGQSYPQSRLGLVIAKRFAKRAVDRNRIKRLLRQQFVVERLPALDIFVRLSGPVAGSCRSVALSREVAELWLAVVRRCGISSDRA
jgi:ribonuclease P protein component